MIKKLHAISVYDYVTLLCEEIGCEWADESEDLYNGLCNTNTVNGKIKTKKQR